MPKMMASKTAAKLESQGLQVKMRAIRKAVADSTESRGYSMAIPTLLVGVLGIGLKPMTRVALVGFNLLVGSSTPLFSGITQLSRYPRLCY